LGVKTSGNFSDTFFIERPPSSSLSIKYQRKNHYYKKDRRKPFLSNMQPYNRGEGIGILLTGDSPERSLNAAPSPLP
jgi:hypothetical protein